MRLNQYQISLHQVLGVQNSSGFEQLAYTALASNIYLYITHKDECFCTEDA